MSRVLSSAVVSAGLAVAAFAFAGAASAEHAVPFKGSFSGTATISGAVVSIAASGQATHLGRSSQTLVATLTPGPGPFCQTTVGTGVLTAANGDQIFVSASGTACVNPSTGVIHIAGTQTITGGTGRFQNASGTLTVSGTADSTTLQLSYTLDGSIST